jgi:hypothetical protein
LISDAEDPDDQRAGADGHAWCGAGAGGSTVNIEQYGHKNAIGGGQHGYRNRLTVYQNGRGNTAISTQHGVYNRTVIGQNGRWNSADTYQRGRHNIVGSASSAPDVPSRPPPDQGPFATRLRSRAIAQHVEGVVFTTTAFEGSYQLHVSGSGGGGSSDSSLDPLEP